MKYVRIKPDPTFPNNSCRSRINDRAAKLRYITPPTKSVNFKQIAKKYASFQTIIKA